MDRLLCGDVGVGKTEVALRAAFKCVMGGKQCAILAPTTILAWQHFNTAIARMEAYPIRIGLLSRYRSSKEQKETLRGLKDGTVDIVVGTHRLLSDDVKFRDLGLVIIDEEQRFGVKHKEKLKEAFIGVDMLTLSATPIPRTLNMALSGIRDMSTIEQPPFERQPVETYVLEYDEGIVSEAIRKELARGGQVYYLHNRVDTINECAARIGKLVPGARIGIAHGKMTEEQISSVWQQLLDNEIDVLSAPPSSKPAWMCATATPSSSKTPTAWAFPSCTSCGAGWVVPPARPTLLHLHPGTRCSPRWPPNGFRPSGSSPPSGRGSASPCGICRSAAPAAFWATASTATWRPWAMISM